MPFNAKSGGVLDDVRPGESDGSGKICKGMPFVDIEKFIEAMWEQVEE